MITEANLIAAAEAIDAETSICGEPEDFAQTRDTIADFEAEHGKPAFVSEADNGLTVYEWSVGKRTLAVVDFGAARAALCM